MSKTIEQVVAEARERGMTYGKFVSLTEPPVRAPVSAEATERAAPQRFCPVCGQPLPDERSNRKYCSPACRDVARSRCVIEWRKRHKAEPR